MGARYSEGLAKAVLCLLAGLLGGLWSHDVPAAETIGQVEAWQAVVRLDRGSAQWPITKDTPLNAHDSLTTNAQGRVQIRFQDGSSLVVGEQSHVVLDDFVYRSGTSTVLLASHIFGGAVRFTGGRHASSGGFHGEFRTAVATIGIRGTDVWIGDMDGALGVLLLRGSVDVWNAGGGVRLDQPGQGTTIHTATDAPDGVRLWPADKKRRALARTALR